MSTKLHTSTIPNSTAAKVERHSKRTRLSEIISSTQDNTGKIRPIARSNPSLIPLEMLKNAKLITGPRSSGRRSSTNSTQISIGELAAVYIYTLSHMRKICRLAKTQLTQSMTSNGKNEIISIFVVSMVTKYLLLFSILRFARWTGYIAAIK